MEILPIQHDEGAVLKDIWLRALRDTPTAFGARYHVEVVKPESHWRELAQQVAHAADHIVLIAAVDNHACGMVHARIDTDQRDLVHVGAMWVDPGMRRQGIARQLFEAITTWAKQHHIQRFELWVTAGNDAAIKLYERLGFRDTGHRAALPSDPTFEIQQMIWSM